MGRSPKQIVEKAESNERIVIMLTIKETFYRLFFETFNDTLIWLFLNLLLRTVMISVSEAKQNFNNLVASGNTSLVAKNSKLIAAIVPYEEYTKLYSAYRRMKIQEAIDEADAYKSGEKGKLSEAELDQYLKDRFSHAKEKSPSN